MDLLIHITQFTKEESREYVPLCTSMDLLTDMLATKKKRLQKKYDEFAAYWEQNAETLLTPIAYLADVSHDALDPMIREQNCSFEGPCLPTRFLYAIWTVGSGLEQEVETLFSTGMPMSAMFLDIAGSRMLLRIHTVIQQWIRVHVAMPHGHHILAELYPGTNFFQTIDLDAFIKQAEAGDMIRTTALHEMLIPRKSMYAVFLLGEGPEQMLDAESRCPGCQEDACLYRQMGGCHINEGT